eukprot:m.553966 g.553966  ORF g.553966 m.553966 type:complete len:81 (+) comp57743_c0_seq36:190-432(+)
MSVPDFVQQQFEALDLNRSGFLEIEELDGLLASMGVSDAEERAARLPDLLASMDTDEDRCISLHEFYAAIASTRTTTVIR